MSQPRQFSLQIATKPIWVTPGGIPPKQQDAFVKVVLVAKDALSFALQSGALPAGMTLSSAGQLAGTPTVAGTYTFTVRAIGEAANVFADQVHTIVIAPLPSWTTVTAPAQLVGDPASFQFEAVGAVSYAVQSGALPAGLSLNANGLMTGTPTAVQSASFGVRASSQSFEADRSFAIQVRAPPVWSTSAALQDAVQNAPLLVQLQATQAPAYYVASGSLPAGTTLSAEGVLEGTPMAAGTFAFAVLASNAPGKGTLRTFTVVVAPSPVWVTGDVLDFLLGTLGSQQLNATNATSYAALGSLPAGLTLTAGGLLSGTPSSKGKYALAVRASSSASVFTVKTFEITVAAVPVFATAAALPTAFLTGAASTLLVASDALSYATTSGALPPGLTLSAAGELRGTYTSIGQYSATVRASGTASIAFADRAFTQLVVSEPVWVTTSPLSEILQAEPVSIQLAATYATSYSVVSGVVPGLSLSRTGLLTGSPVNAGLTDLVVRAETGNAGVYKDRTLQAFVDTRPVWVTAAGPLTAAPQTLFSTFSFSATGALTYAVQSGTIPAGLTLSSAGVLSGTATTVESTSFTIRAYKASLTNYTDRAFTLQVSALPVWATSASLTDVAKDAIYSVTLQATNTVGYTLQSGALPAGLSLNSSTGALTGTPTAATTYTFTIRATRSPGVFADRTFTQIVALTPTWITSATFDRTKTVAVTIALVANDSTSYAVVAGALPDGTSLSATGSLTGTPTTAGPATFTVRAYSTASTLVFADRVFTVTIWNIPTWTTAATLTGTADAAYSLQLSAIDAQTYSVTAGTLPTGVSLSASGLLSGTPTVSQTASFTVTAQGGATEAIAPRAFTLVVATTPTWTTGATLANTAKDVAYSFTLVASNASATGFSVQSGSPPPGISLSNAGILSGTPTAQATYSFTVRALSTTSPDVFADRTFSLTTVPLPVWTTTSLTDVPSGSVYSVQLAATNAVSYALKTGTLPTGLSLSNGGLLTGTPSAAGSFSFTITATGNASNALTDQALTQIVATTPTWSTAASLAATAQSVAYSFSLVATNASATGYSVVSGALPAGVTLGTNGILSGTPTASATYNFTVRALSTTSTVVFADRAFTLTTVPLPVWTTTSLTDVAAGVVYSVQLAATNAVSFALKTGALPTGLSLSSGGLLTGTPSAAGSFSFTITATGNATNALTDQALTQLVATTPTWTTAASLASTAQSVAYSFTLVATNASATGYSLQSGTLPAGVTLSNAGVLSGTPTAATTYNFTVRALSTTSSLVFADRAFSLTTVPLPVWSSPAAGALTEVATGTGTAITTINFVATNGVSYAVTVGTLPTGLSLSTGGQLTGTPSAAGSFSFTVTATGGATNATADRAFSQLVAATPVWTTGATLTDIPDSTVVSFQFAATSAVSYALTAGTLPPGLSLSAGGLMTGTAGLTVASYSFTIRATGSSAVAFADRAFTQNVVSNLVINYVPYRGMSKGLVSTVVLASDGTVYACGDNSGGVLTGVAGTSTNLMTQVPGLSNIVRVADTTEGSLWFAQNASGQWFSWGQGTTASRGDGTTTAGNYTLPVSPWNVVPNMTRILYNRNSVSFFAKRATGDWVCWGFNGSGELGNGTTTPVYTATLFTALSNIKDISAGNDDVGFLFLLEDGRVFATGNTGSGGAKTTPFLVMTGGARVFGGMATANFVQKTDGTWWCWGANGSQNMGLGNATDVPVTAPVRNTYLEGLGPISTISVTSGTALIRLANGNSIGLGNRSTFDATAGTGTFVLSDLPSVHTPLAGRSHCMWMTTTGSLYTAGSNGNFQCGFNTGNPRARTLLTTTFTLAPIAINPTWNTPAAFSMVSGTPKRLDASDAGTYVVQSGSLPSGMTLSTDGLISGNAIAGSYGFTVRAYGATSAVYADKAFTVTIGAAGIKKIETSETYSLILTTDGSVYSVGTSTVGSLGNGAATSYAVPTKITALSNIVDIACTGSDDSNAAVDAAGVVWCWGKNTAAASTGTNTAAGTNISTPIQNTFVSGVARLCGGGAEIWAITTAGAVWTWGVSQFDWVAGVGARTAVPVQKTGLPTNVVYITNTNVCACALTATGDTWTFFRAATGAGANDTPWLGTGVTSNFNVPTKLSSGVAAIGASNDMLHQLMTNGDVFYNGYKSPGNVFTYYPTPTKNIAASGQGVAELYGGYGSACFMRTSAGALYYFDQSKGNDWLDVTTMIYGDFVPVSTTVPMVKFLTPTRRIRTGMLQGTDGKVYAIGSDSWSATDVGTNFSPVPRQVTVITSLLQSGTVNTATGGQFRAMKTADTYTMVVASDGNVYGCGNNTDGRITGVTGSNSSSFVQVSGLSNIVRLAQGYFGSLTCFGQDAGGRWYSWGRALDGSRGDGTVGTSNAIAPAAWTSLTDVVRMVSSSGQSTFAQTSAGTWYCWGRNSTGELGNGSTTTVNSPVLFTALSNVKDIVGGATGFVFLLNDGNVYATGRTDGNRADLTTPALIISNVASIYGGGSSGAFVLKNDGTWWCWGLNGNRSLGFGNETYVPSTAPARNTYLESLGTIRNVMMQPNATVVVTQAGAAYGMGLKAHFTTGTSEVGNFALSMPAAYDCATSPAGHSAWITTSGLLYTGGSNSAALGAASAPIVPTAVTTSFNVASIGVSPGWVTSADLSGAALNAAYSKTLGTQDGYSFALVSGSLPTGLTLSTAGVLSGTPTTAGSYGFTVRAFGGSTSAYADRAFAMDFSGSSIPDVEFESLKTASRIANVSNVYDIGAYSFLPVAGAYDFVVLGQSSTTTLATRMTCSLFTGGTYNTYDALPRDAALNGATMAGSSTTTVTANTNYYVRYTFATNLLTAVLCTSFTPATWTFSGVIATTSWTIVADMGDVSLEALKFSTSGVGTLSGVWSRNTPVLATMNGNATRGLSGNGLYLSSTGDVYFTGNNANGNKSGVVGSAANLHTKISGLPPIAQLYGINNGGLNWGLSTSSVLYQWGVSTANERGDGTATAGLMAPTPWTSLQNVRKLAGCGDSKYAMTADGTWYRWGPNTNGELCTGDTTAMATPTKFSALTGIREVYGGGYGGNSVVFHMLDGKMYGAGNFAEGGGNRTTPLLIATGVTQVIDMSNSYFFRKTDGLWYWFGTNDNGGLMGSGTATDVPATAPILAAYLNAAPFRTVNGFANTAYLTRSNGVMMFAGEGVIPGVASTATPVQISGTPGNLAFSHYSKSGVIDMVTWNGQLWTAGSNGGYEAGTTTPASKPIGQITIPFALAPLSKTPTWITPAAFLNASAGGVVFDRVEALDARMYKVVSGSLPTGLTLSIDGLISGTATASGSFGFAVRAYGMTSGSIADRTFAWTVDSQSLDTTFEAYKTAGTIAKVSNAYNLGAYSFLPTSGSYDFVVSDQTTTTTAAAQLTFSLFTGGTSASGAFSTYVLSPSTATKDAVAMTAVTNTGASTVTANTPYFARLRVEATQMTYSLYTSFAPSTWSFGAPILTRTFAVNAADVSLENMVVSTDANGTLQNVYSVNAPVMLTFTPYNTNVSGNGNGAFLLSSVGDVYFTGNNSTGGMSGVVGATNNGLTKVTGLSGISQMGEGERNTSFQFARAANGVWWQWGTYSANEQGTGSTTSGTIAPTVFSPAYTFARIVSVGTSKFAKTSSGQWYCWGPNGNGSLGLGNTTAVPSPTPFGALSGIRDILGGNNSGTFFWLDNGAVYFSGNANDGGGNRTTPVQLLTSVQRLFAGGNGSYHAHKTDGTWWSAGWNSNGQLGIGNTTTLAVTSPVRNSMLEASPVRMIHVGQDSMIVVRASGAVIGAGSITSYRNSTGNAISGETLSIANSIATAYIEYSQMFATTWDGKVFSSGINTNFQTGNTSNTTTKDPAQLTLGFTMAPLSRTPTWNTASALTVLSFGVTVSIRLDATDARLYKVIAGTLPAGLSLAADGLLTGAVSAAGSYSWTVRAFGMTSGAYADRTFTATAGQITTYANVGEVFAARSSQTSTVAVVSNELLFSTNTSAMDLPLACDLSYSSFVMELDVLFTALNGADNQQPVFWLYSGSSVVGLPIRFWTSNGYSQILSRNVFPGAGEGGIAFWLRFPNSAIGAQTGMKYLAGYTQPTAAYQKWKIVVRQRLFRVYINNVLQLDTSVDFAAVPNIANVDFGWNLTRLQIQANGTQFKARNFSIRNFEPVTTYANVSAVLAAATTATSVSVNGSNELAFTATNSALTVPLTFDLASDSFVMSLDVRFTALNGADNQQPIFYLYSGATQVGLPIRFWTGNGYSAMGNKTTFAGAAINNAGAGDFWLRFPPTVPPAQTGMKYLAGFTQPTAAYQTWRIVVQRRLFQVFIDGVLRMDTSTDFTSVPNIANIDFGWNLTSLVITANGTTMTVRNMTISNASTTWTTAASITSPLTVSYQLAAINATSFTSSTLPAGLSLSAGGLLTGTLTTGTYAFTVRATGAADFADRTFSLAASNILIPGTSVNPTIWMDGTSFTGGVWTNKVSGGSASNSTINSGVAVATQTGLANGCNATFPYLYGGTTATLALENGWPQGDYTMLHVTRYTGGSSGRIWNGKIGNWLSGHYNGVSGAVYHDSTLTTLTGGLTPNTNWILTMDQLRFARVNSGALSGSYAPATNPTGVGINVPAFPNVTNGQLSDWATAEVIVWPSTLGSADYLAAEAYLKSKYGFTY
jgi:alpha-tubulin suppressor-like RCC1 family protein